MIWIPYLGAVAQWGMWQLLAQSYYVQRRTLCAYKVVLWHGFELPLILKIWELE